MRKAMQKGAIPALLLTSCLVWMVPNAYAETDALAVRYTGNEDAQVIAGAELFSHVDNGLPGDVFIGSMKIANASDDACEMFIRPQDVVAKGPDDMLDRIPFVVEAKGETLFDGVLADMEYAEPIGVGKLEVGESVSVDCMAVIPSELTNEYADAAVGMNVAVGPRTAGMDGKGEDDGSSGDNALVPTSATDQGAKLVQAGDVLRAAPFVVGPVAAAGAVIWCAWKRRMRMW